MTNSKLIECSNTPWDPRGDRPDHIYLWVSPKWNRDELIAEHTGIATGTMFTYEIADDRSFNLAGL